MKKSSVKNLTAKFETKTVQSTTTSVKKPKQSFLDFYQHISQQPPRQQQELLSADTITLILSFANAHEYFASYAYISVAWFLRVADFGSLQWRQVLLQNFRISMPTSKHTQGTAIWYKVFKQRAKTVLQFFQKNAVKLQLLQKHEETSIPDIEHDYVPHMIQNCNDLAFQCPLLGENLSRTSDTEYFCSVCSHTVYYCKTEQELNAKIQQGECVMYHSAGTGYDLNHFATLPMRNAPNFKSFPGTTPAARPIFFGRKCF